MYCDPQQFDGTPNLLYHNNGDGTFTEVSKKAGIANPAGKGLGVAVGDIDGEAARHLCGQRWVRNFLYRNRGNGTFADITYGAGVGFDMDGKALAGMGTEIADYDGDGLPDIFLTAFSRPIQPVCSAISASWSLKTSRSKRDFPPAFRRWASAKVFDFDNDG